MRPVRAILIWSAVALAVAVPVIAAAQSPLLAWREPVYVAAGFAGVVSLGLLLLQPLLIGGYLPGVSPYRRRRWHVWVGTTLVVAAIVHVTGLWVTSPPDVIDALLFRAPTPFSAWGVIAMWAVFLAALLAALRRPLRIRPRIWRVGHVSLALIIGVGAVAHAMLIEGTMEAVSKTVLCLLIVAAFVMLMVDRRGRGIRTTSRRAMPQSDGTPR